MYYEIMTQNYGERTDKHYKSYMEKLNLYFATNGEQLTLSGIPRQFRLIEEKLEFADLVFETNNFITDTAEGYKYKNAYNKLCAFTLRNIHHYDKYVMRAVTCYCTLRDYIKLQRCEACIIKCTASTKEKAFIVDEIVDLVCPEDEEIANNKDCSINHIPRDFVFGGGNGNKQNSIKKARKYVDKYIDVKKFDIAQYKGYHEDYVTREYLKYTEERYSKLGEFLRSKHLPYNFLWDLFEEIIQGQIPITGDGSFKGMFLTVFSLAQMNRFITLAYVNLYVNKWFEISFDFIVSVCAKSYNKHVLDFINKDNRLTDEQKMDAIKYYTTFYNSMINDFNASFENERDAEAKLTFVNEKYMPGSF